MKIFTYLVLFCFVGVISLNAQFSILHDFGGDGDGAYHTHNRVISDGVNTLYGMTSGDNDGYYGSIYRMDKDGSNYQELYSFSGEAEGGFPLGSLIKVGNVLYGVTNYGGTYNLGVLFEYNLSNDQFLVLHHFNYDGDGNFDGANPVGTLVYYSGKLFGMTTYGGFNNIGTIFSYDIDMSNFNTEYDFPIGGEGPTYGMPEGDLIISNGVLYGMADGGVTRNEDNVDGALFSYDTDSQEFNLLNIFPRFETQNGMIPNGYRLAKVGNMLYGNTASDGEGGSQIFSYDLSNDVFAYLPFNSFGSVITGGFELFNFGMGNFLIFNVAGDGSLLSLYNLDENDVLGFAPVDLSFSGYLIEGGSIFGTSYYGGDLDRGTVFRSFNNGPPSTQASRIVFTSVTQYQIAFKWTNGDGEKRVVVGKADRVIGSNPLNDNTTYIGNNYYSRGTMIDNGYAVYNGTGNSVTVKGLTRGRLYHFKVFEYNGSAGSETYNQDNAPYNPSSKLTLKKEIADDLNPTFDDKMISIYPNPAIETVTVTLNIDYPGQYELTIFNESGKLLENTYQNVQLRQGKNEVKLDVSKLVSGNYNVMINGDGGFIYDAFVIQR